MCILLQPVRRYVVVVRYLHENVFFFIFYNPEHLLHYDATTLYETVLLLWGTGLLCDILLE